MKGSKYLYEATLATLLSAIACGCAHDLASHSGGAPSVAIAESAEPALTAPQAQALSPNVTSRSQTPGLVVHIDPLTGQILPKPPVSPSATILDSQQFRSAPVVAPPPIEVVSPVPGGGVQVDLQRRFHQPLFATTGGDGTIKFEHRPAHPQPE